MQDRFESFTRDITALYRLIQKIKHAEMTKLGLKGMHVMCLYFLYKNPEGLTASMLSEKCAEDKAAISRSIAILKEKGLAVESQNGETKKYRSIIKLTEAGREIAGKEAEKIVNAVIAGGDGLTKEMRKSFYDSLSLISANLEKYVETL